MCRKLAQSYCLRVVFCCAGARGLLAPDIGAADLPVFVARGGDAPVTVGVDVAVVPLRAGGAIVLLDMEGIDNFDHPVLSILLGFLTQITGRVAFVADRYRNQLFEQLNRTAAAVRILNASPGQVPLRAPLHIVFNLQRADATSYSTEQIEGDARFQV